MEKRGLYIVVDGLDGSGKGGVIQALKHRYPQMSASEMVNDSDSFKVIYEREPGGTDIGERLRPIILNEQIDPVTEFFLFCAQRKEIRSHIKEMLAHGVSVISDRGDSSTFAFQIYGRDLHELTPMFFSVKSFLLPEPDLYIFLDLPTDVAMARIKRRTDDGGDNNRIDQEAIDFHERVRIGFQEFSKHTNVPCKVVDATQAPEEVAAEVIAVVAELFGK